jgi:hypothetical protein
VARITGEDLDAHGLTRAEVLDARLEVAEFVRWLGEQRQRELGD